MTQDRRTSLDDVARAAGVSLSTASRALRNHPTISRATALKVQEVARQLAYHPNPLVRSLMTQVRTRRVGEHGAALAYLDMSPSRTFWQGYAVTRSFLEGARTRVVELGYTFERFFPQVEGYTRQRLTRILEARGIRGLLLPVHVEHEPARLTLEDIPVDFARFAAVAIGGEYAAPAVHFSTNNQYMSGRLARTHIDALGYRRPAIVIEPKVDRSTDSRFQAGFFSLDWPQPTMPVPPFLGKPGDEAAFATWFRTYRPDCIAANFPYVLGWLRELGVSVPRDCAFVCLDWDEGMRELGGIDQRSAAVAAAAVDLLVGQIDRNEVGYPKIAQGLFIRGVWVDGPSVPRRASPARRRTPPGRDHCPPMAP